MSEFPLPPHRLPGLTPLLAGRLWECWVGEGRVGSVADLRGAVRYIRLKPTTSCRIAVLGDDRGDVGAPPAGFLLHLFADAERARTAFAKVASRPTFEPSDYRPFLSEEHAVFVVPFPNDLEVPGLRHVYRPHRLRKALYRMLTEYPEESWEISKRQTRLQMLAYKPGRRGVFRADVHLDHRECSSTVRLPLHLKVENPDLFPTSHARLRAIHDAVRPDARWRVPCPTGLDSKRHVTVTEWIEGEPLDRRVLENREPLEGLIEAGQALAGLHALGARQRTAPDDGAEPTNIERIAEDLGELLPVESARCVELGRRLARAAKRLRSEEPTTLHGDFHLAQVLTDASGTVLVDFDRSTNGPAAIDVGTLRAHLREVGAPERLDAAFLGSYRAAHPSGPGLRSIEAATLIGLFRRAVFPFRQLDPDWPAVIARRLDEIESRLGALA